AFEPPDDDELLAWFRAGHDALIRTLAEADPAVEAFTFLPAPSALAFWARRQAHETAIHSADAEAAAGIAASFPADFAVDGLDELLGGFMSRSGGRLCSDPPVTLAVAALDAGRAWTMRIGPDGGSCEPGRVTASPTGHAAATPTGFGAASRTGPGSDMTADTAADATVRGTASDLYLFLWNRLDRDAIALDGDPAVLDLWRDQANVRWG
ncbi:MAG TPA: maleylpyruvate isomerase family mycothiol-dependent enzyme, partial [Micromonosporaceae bacterium]